MSCCAAQTSAWWVGCRVCTSTRPPFGPRPARPATWASSWKVRSAARKSGQVEAGVGIHHADQRHVGEVEPLGDHLRAEQEVDLARLDRGEDPLVRPLGARGVEVHARQPRLGIALGEQPLELLGAEAAHLLHRAGAGAAGERQRLLVAAVVAAQARRRRVDRERDAAARALPHLAAVGALEEGREAAAVEQQQRLLLPRERRRRWPRRAPRTRRPPRCRSPWARPAGRPARPAAAAARRSARAAAAAGAAAPPAPCVSSDGVALPSTRPAPSIRARTAATSRAW